MAGSGGEASAGSSQPQHGDAGRVWERFPNAEFRDKLAIAEQTADKSNYGYSEVNSRSGALGRYQMTPTALRAAGMIDTNGHWTGKYGANSAGQFLANPQAQELTLTAFLADSRHQLQASGAFKYLGHAIEGRQGSFPVTVAGLIAAAHREGAPATRDYLQQVEDYDFRTRGRRLSPRDLRIETRIRTFSGTSYE